MKENIQKYWPFLVLIGGLFFLYNYHQVLSQPPQSVHQWRQTDSGAQVMRYVHNNFNVFDSGTYNLNSKDGKGLGEFPLIYLFDAALIKIGLPRDLVIRGVNLLLFYFGLFFLFKIGLLLFKNKYLALMPVVLHSAYPIATYYATAAVPNIPAFGFAMAGVYYLIAYIDNRKTFLLFLCIVFTSLAGLNKPPSLLPFLSVCSILFFSFLSKRNQYQSTLKLLFILTIPLIISFVWVKVADVYNTNNGNYLFMLEAKPIWSISRDYIDQISHRMKTSWIYEYVFLPTFWISIVGSIGFIALGSKRNNLIKIAMLLLLVGTMAYMYLLFEQFYHHDYYALEMLPLITVFFMATIFIIQKLPKTKIRLFILLSLSILLVVNSLYARKNMIKRYSEGSQLTVANEAYHKLRPKLKTLGIDSFDKIVVGGDHSSNISLYLLDQMGWTRFSGSFTADQMNYFIDNGAKYFISDTTEINNRMDWTPYLKEKILTQDHLAVFILK